MNKLILIIGTVLFFQFQSIGQDNQLIQTTNDFVEIINTKDFKKFDKSLSSLVRLVTKKSFRQELLNNFTAEGKWIVSEIKPLDSLSTIIGFHVDADPEEERQFITLNFNEKFKIARFNLSEDNILYPPLNEVKSIDDIVNPYMDFENNCGLVIGIFDNGKKQFFEYGELEKGNGNTPNSMSLFQIGSISKIFTGTLLAQMHIDKKLTINDEVNQFLPKEIPVLANKKRNIQLLDLATHTSRLDRDFDIPRDKNFDENNPFKAIDRKDLYTYLDNVKIDKHLGEKYQYSNIGMGMLALILADFHHKDIQQTLDDYLFNALEMEHTKLVLEKEDTNKATSYSWGKKIPDFITNDAMQGAGGIYSCTNDLVRLIEHVVDSNHKMNSTFDLATQVHSTTSEKMGLGWIHLSSEMNNFIGHEGNTPGSSSMLLISKEKQFGVIVLGNSSVKVNKIAMHIADYYLANR